MTQGKNFAMEEEFAGLDFHSLRLEERFVRAMETLIRQPGASI
ncbi:MAG: transposase [Treponema sp.]|nr:transposase [Treponema sp.]